MRERCARPFRDVQKTARRKRKISTQNSYERSAGGLHERCARDAFESGTRSVRELKERCAGATRVRCERTRKTHARSKCEISMQKLHAKSKLELHESYRRDMQRHATATGSLHESHARVTCERQVLSRSSHVALAEFFCEGKSW